MPKGQALVCILPARTVTSPPQLNIHAPNIKQVLGWEHMLHFDF